ncbi:MAG: glycosyltransferase [Solirubrobacterales bacterium]
MQPDISIIVPVYNSEIYLKMMMESILAQTLKNIEVILVDDGSTDGSRGILEAYKQRDSRIIVLCEENKGVSAARNAGIAAANGIYIGFVDSDDWIEKDMYETMLKEGHRNNSDVVICDFYSNVYNGETIKNFDKNKGSLVLDRTEIISEICSELLIEGFFTSVCNKIYSKSMILKNDISFKSEVKLREDFFFNMDIFNAAQLVTYIPRNLYNYRNNEEGACKGYYKDAFENSVKIFEYKLKYYEIWNIKSDKIKSVMILDFMLAVRCCINNIFDLRNKDKFFQKTNYVYYMLNDPLVISTYSKYKALELEKTQGKFERWASNRIGHKSILILSLFYHYSNKIPGSYKNKVKKLLKL